MEDQAPQVKKRKVEGASSSVVPFSNLQVKKLSQKAKLPTRGSPLAAGYDMYR
jgi:dUTP pyrophosphatase